MIIEAGYDVLELFAHRLFPKKKSRTGMWVLLLDRDLRNIRVAPVRSDDSWPSRTRAITKALRSKKNYRKPAYFVVARRDTSITGDEAWHEQCEALEAMDVAGVELLGSMLSCGREVYSSVARYSFRDYPSLEHLPRPAICEGPHAFINCPCLACVQYEDRLAAARRSLEPALSA